MEPRDEPEKPGGSDRARALHQALVQGLKRRGLLPDSRVEAAFRAVPRHLFLPEVPLDTVYVDDAIPTRKQDGIAISSSSQPTVMAIMLAQLGPQPGDRVLEIGAGTGFNAALMSHIVGPVGHVISLDIDEDIVADARAHLVAAGASEVDVVCRDGALGYAEASPYDRIILTVGAGDIAPAWIDQLRPGGRLVLPLALNGTIQKLVAFERRDWHLVSVSITDGSFMPLRGLHAGPNAQFALGPKRDLVLGTAATAAIDPARVYGLITGPYEDIPLEIRATSGELWAGAILWLALHAPTMCSLVATGEAAAHQLIPSPLSSSPTYRATAGLLGEDSICVLARGPDEAVPLDDMPFGVAIRCFGPRDGVAQRLIDHLHDWSEAGRPSTDGLRITAFPRDMMPANVPHGHIIDKPQTRLVLEW